MGVLLGPFELVEPAARGGMAEVWRAVHRERDVPVAIKVITGDFAKDPAYQARFADEVRAVAALDHPGIAMILDHGKVGADAASQSDGRLRAGTPWLAMEYCSQGTLSSVRMPLRWSRIRHILLSALDALAHAHARGVVHRDLKPPNLLRAGPRDLRPGLKIADFGIAWVGQQETGTPMGTPQYMAPEQIQIRWRDYGPWTDLYSMGCIAWWLVAGRTPFRARRVAETLVGHLHRDPPFLDAQLAIPDGFEDWCRILLAKHPRDRYQHAADAAEALARLEDPPDDEGWDDSLLPEAPNLDSTLVALTGQWEEPEDGGTPDDKRPRPATPPDTWRHRRVEPPPPALVGAGLSLYGLRTVRMAGREAERDVLWRELLAVQQTGRARAVLIRGAAGTGKSRLAEWLCQRSHEVGAANIGKARFSTELAPGEALQRMGRDYFRVHGLDREDVANRVEEWMGPYGASPEDRLLLTEILEPATEADLASGAPSVRLTGPRDYLAAIATTFRHLTTERPMVVWLDDVQWGVHGLGLALQLLLGQAERQIPVLLILTLRTEALPEDGPEVRRLEKLTALPDSAVVDLAPLSSAEQRGLVTDVLGALEPGLVARVLERTAGNPLFAVQLLGNWVQQGVLVAGERGLRLAEGADAALPDDLHQVWQDQVDRVLERFGDSARTYLEIAAILGQTVDRAEWRAACDDPEGHFGDRFPGDQPLRDALVERMLHLRLAVGTVQRWSFVHTMLRESLEREAREADRAQGHHLACAQVLGRKEGWAVHERLGRHLLAAGLPDRAIDPLLRGVGLRRLTAGPEPALALLPLAEQAVDEAGLPDHDPRRGQLAVLRARIAADGEDRQAALAAVQQALTQAEAHGWEDVALEATAVRGSLRLADRDYTAAEVDLTALRDQAVKLDHALRTGTANVGLAEVCRARGDFLAARAALVDALSALAEAGDTPEARAEEANAWRLLGRCAAATGDDAEAIARYQGARERYDRLGYALGAADCLDHLGRLAADAGDLDAAAERLAAALSRYEALGSERRFTCRLRLGLVHAHNGHPSAAWEAIGEVQAVGAHLDPAGNIALGHALRLARAAVDEDWNAWADAFAQTATSLPRTGMAPGLVAWLGHIAGVLTGRAGRAGLAKQALRASAAIWSASGQVGRAAEVTEHLESLNA